MGQPSDSPMDCPSCSTLRRWGWLVSLLVCCASAFAEPGRHLPFEVTGTVIGNHDGDTLTLSTPTRGTFSVRLSGADTPETGQAYWRSARSALRQLVAGGTVTVYCYKRDRYDREVCHASVNGKDLGEALISGGHAWYARTYAGELTAAQQEAYDDAEHRAQARRLGLWADPDPMAPWICRKLRRERQKCR